MFVSRKFDCLIQTTSFENDIPEEEEGTDVGDFSSNLEGYPKSKGKNEKGNEEDISEGNSKKSNFDNEGNQTDSSGGKKDKEKPIQNPVVMIEEEQMVKTTPPTTEIGGQDKEDHVQNENPVETGEEEQMETEEQIDKVASPPCEIVEDTSDSPQRETKLSFMHSAKLKSDSMLQVDSWIYNELMGLKKKVETMQHN